MKKVLYSILLGLIVLCHAKTYAQSTATVNLGINLSDVVSLTIPTTSLTFSFNNEAAYTNGVTNIIDDHLDVMSSRNYTISVSAGTITGPSGLTAASVKLVPSASTFGGNYTGVAYSTVNLATTSTALIVSTASSFDASHAHTKYKVSYIVGANKAYAGKASGTNTIPVIYTITQP